MISSLISRSASRSLKTSSLNSYQLIRQQSYYLNANKVSVILPCVNCGSTGINGINKIYGINGQFVKCYSSASQSGPGANNPDNPEFTEEDARREVKIRRYKKIFSTLLFAGTLVAVLYGRRRKMYEREENFQGCVRLPVDENFKGSHKEFYRCGKDPAAGKEGCVVPLQMVKDGTLKAIKKFEVKPDDVFVASFPKSGTTWVQEIVYLMMNDLDFEKASEKTLETRFPYLEYPYPGLSTVVKAPSPRFIKTHLPLDLLPEGTLKAKVIYVARNPKDTVVSYYHFSRMLAFSSFQGSFEEFERKFMKDELPYCPYFGHINSFVKERDNPNLLILTYEELTRSPAEAIRKIGRFLEKPLSDAEVELLVLHTSFKRMAENPSVNYSHWDEFGIRNKGEAQFMRKGKVGDWRNYFTEKSNKDFDEWIRENNRTGFSFEYEV